MWQALFSPIGILLVLAFLLSFGLTNFEGIFGLYALERFNYGPQQVGLLLTAHHRVRRERSVGSCRDDIGPQRRVQQHRSIDDGAWPGVAGVPE